MAEAQAAMTAQLHVVRGHLQSAGYAVSSAEGPAGFFHQQGLATAGRDVSSSALSADEQRRFLQSMQRQ
jgi:hypothetical protein